MTPSSTTRRRLLQGFSAGVVPYFASGSSLLNAGRRKPPSDRIAVGIVGLGSRGFNLIDELLPAPDVTIVAICDVDSLHYRDKPWGKGTAYGLRGAEKKILAHENSPGTLVQTSDFRQLCERSDLDVVVVATPDHWHALVTLAALRSGKDVYCEKPITHTFSEGRVVVGEVQKQRAMFQTGSQQRSDWRFRRVVELVRNGRLGTISKIAVGLPPGYDLPQGDTTIGQPPQHLDYENWTGPAAMLPYMRARSHRWWRGHSAYGGGVLMDWIGHHNDIAHWALDLDQSGPRRVETIRWSKPKTPIYDTAHEYEIRCAYESGATSSIGSNHRVGVRIEGDLGWVFVTRGRLLASDARWTKPQFRPGPTSVTNSNNHVRNFIDGVKSRKQCIAPAETGHRSITPGHLARVSHLLDRPLNWNPSTETVLDDPEADRLLKKNEYRNPWEI